MGDAKPSSTGWRGPIQYCSPRAFIQVQAEQVAPALNLLLTSDRLREREREREPAVTESICKGHVCKFFSSVAACVTHYYTHTHTQSKVLLLMQKLSDALTYSTSLNKPLALALAVPLAVPVH